MLVVLCADDLVLIVDPSVILVRTMLSRRP